MCDCMVASAADGPGEYRIELGSWCGGVWVGALVPAAELALTVVGPRLGGRWLDCMHVSQIRLKAAVCLFRSVHLRLTWVRRMLSWASC